MNGARLKHYGWGREGEGMTAAEQALVLGRYRAKFSHDRFETIAVPRLEDLALRAPRVNLGRRPGAQRKRCGEDQAEGVQTLPGQQLAQDLHVVERGGPQLEPPRRLLAA